MPEEGKLVDTANWLAEVYSRRLDVCIAAERLATTLRDELNFRPGHLSPIAQFQLEDLEKKLAIRRGVKHAGTDRRTV